MIDELSSLVGDSIEADAAESTSIPLPTPDFTGSLDYIDSLASRSALSISRRDVAAITTALSSFDYLGPLLGPKAVPSPTDVGFYSSSSDFRPLGDARRFDPEGFVRAPRALNRAASRIIAGRDGRLPRSEFPPGWVNPLDPTRDRDDLNRTFIDIERRLRRHPFSFKRPNQVVICLKRKIRRQIMHSMGFAGKHYVPRHLNRWSWVVC